MQREKFTSQKCQLKTANHLSNSIIDKIQNFIDTSGILWICTNRRILYNENENIPDKRKLANIEIMSDKSTTHLICRFKDGSQKLRK